MEKYSFGMRTNAEIKEQIGIIVGGTFSDDDLTKPQPETMKRVYERLLHEATQFSSEESRQINFHRCNMLAYPELHDESIGEVAFIRSLIRFMKSIGANDFGTRDIYRPEYQRTKKALSALINFFIYRDQKINIHMEMSKEVDDTITKHGIVKEEAIHVADEYEQVLEKKAILDKEVSDLRDELHHSESQLETLVKEYNDTKAAYEQLDTVNQELLTKIEQYNFSISSISQEISNIDPMIVRSPDKVKRMLENMENNIIMEREEITRLDDEIKKIQFKYNRVDKMKKDMSKTLSLVEKATDEHQKYKKVRQILKDLQKKYTDQQKSLKDLEGVITRLEKNCSSQSDTLASIQQRFKNHKEQWNSTMMEVENETQTLLREKQEIKERCDEIDLQIQANEQELETAIKENEETRRKIIEHFYLLIESIQSYHQSIDSIIESPPEKLTSEYQ
ncbi:hypothetical protein PPL_06934 [Heterostelium album PN500]|uniref:Kinetochore protein Nuf2 n=1 Tax=Heterostelium pallidum (strain ATCC 26659 / Pp 5 / PN500) TaxID=670386 RepID=D3BDY1_HETP5|nr:hypothetical protein PPL_06934 [Heterostelium album PN500]EFA80112.1 hypothetical protein PPL_06934 [Heterostelium album PN500]|eukprot:XP_020432232.1 hypothetical protein PPL_06934 [Heterostelium album PN500]